jgi:hypothetical protein
MRSIIIGFALIGGLVASGPLHAQGTNPYAPDKSAPTASPRQVQAPVGHRQPRPSDLAPNAGGATPSMESSTTLDPDIADARMNRILNGICRGC